MSATNCHGTDYSNAVLSIRVPLAKSDAATRDAVAFNALQTIDQLYNADSFPEIIATNGDLLALNSEPVDNPSARSLRLDRSESCRAKESFT